MKETFSNYITLTRLDKPIGIWLLFLPCLFGIFLALKYNEIHSIDIIKTILLFGLGSVLMRSAGCVINDLWDYKFDAQVARTKTRPLAAGTMRHFDALIFLALLLGMGLFILLQFNQATIISGLAALLLVILYPLMKRITYYPQIFLGLTFNFGILIAGFALLGTINADFIMLYVSAVIWTLIYDTIYAYQDIEDDIKIGVKSSAIKFGDEPRTILITLTLCMFAAIFYVGIHASFQPLYFVINAIAGTALCFAIIKCEFKNPKRCLYIFKNNMWIGLLILIGIIAG